ncbi:MAG: hypothetical protein V1843_01565, partial [bacterium]
MSKRYIWINMVVFTAAALLGYMMILSPKIQERDDMRLSVHKAGLGIIFQEKELDKLKSVITQEEMMAGNIDLLKEYILDLGLKYIPEERSSMVHFKGSFEKVETFL